MIIDSSEFFTFINFHELGLLNNYIFVDDQFEWVVLFVIEYYWISKLLLTYDFRRLCSSHLLPRYMKILRLLVKKVSKRFRYKNKTSRRIC